MAAQYRKKVELTSQRVLAQALSQRESDLSNSQRMVYEQMQEVFGGDGTDAMEEQLFAKVKPTPPPRTHHRSR